MNENGNRASPASLLAKLNEGERAKLRVYIGAAPGVGKTYQMLEDAHLLKKQGADIVVATVEPHGREDTRAMIGDLERVPMRQVEYRGVTLEEMDLDAVISRHPSIAIVDELAHTNIPGSKNRKRYQDVLDLLNAGISVITAVNIQHLESLNDVVSRTTGVRVRETVPDYFLRRADEVVNIDVSVDTLRTRLRQGKIYDL
ncbi:MAG TPA: sensor histidine kinase KdpD, partial [Pyrinomonadaceae bacterium]|nr:sensor histidine kinase KdpD [Pyrinomonadaceae bacterium]